MLSESASIYRICVSKDLISLFYFIYFYYFFCRYGVASTYYGISLNITGFGLDLYLTHFIYAAIKVQVKILIYFSLSKVSCRITQTGTLVLTGFCILINIITPTGFQIKCVISISNKAALQFQRHFKSMVLNQKTDSP